MDKGQPRSDFESGRIGGGMFYNAIEWKEGGYQKMSEHDHAYIRSSSDAGKYNKRARDLIDEGAQVITGFDSIGMGLEGYITMFARFLETNARFPETNARFPETNARFPETNELLKKSKK
jgi:hypothetical protein